MLQLLKEFSVISLALGEEASLIYFTRDREADCLPKKIGALSGFFSNGLALRGGLPDDLDNILETETLQELANLRAGLAAGQI